MRVANIATSLLAMLTGNFSGIFANATLFRPTRARRTRTAGEHRPAGSKLARKAAKRQLTKYHL